MSTPTSDNCFCTRTATRSNRESPAYTRQVNENRGLAAPLAPCMGKPAASSRFLADSGSWENDGALAGYAQRSGHRAVGRSSAALHTVPNQNRFVERFVD